MPFTDHTIMAFGKHKGEKLANVPAGYLLYLYDAKIAKGDLKAYIEDNIPVLRHQKNKDDQHRQDQSSGA